MYSLSLALAPSKFTVRTCDFSLFGSLTRVQNNATNTVALNFVAKFFPLRLKLISGEVAKLRLIFTSALLKQKGYPLPICCYFNKIKIEITKLFCFLP